MFNKIQRQFMYSPVDPPSGGEPAAEVIDVTTPGIDEDDDDGSLAGLPGWEEDTVVSDEPLDDNPPAPAAVVEPTYTQAQLDAILRQALSAAPQAPVQAAPVPVSEVIPSDDRDLLALRAATEDREEYDRLTDQILDRKLARLEQKNKAAIDASLAEQTQQSLNLQAPVFQARILDTYLPQGATQETRDFIASRLSRLDPKLLANPNKELIEDLQFMARGHMATMTASKGPVRQAPRSGSGSPAVPARPNPLAKEEEFWGVPSGSFGDTGRR